MQAIDREKLQQPGAMIRTAQAIMEVADEIIDIQFAQHRVQRFTGCGFQHIKDARLIAATGPAPFQLPDFLYRFLLVHQCCRPFHE